MKKFIIRMKWPPQGRQRYGHAYLYLVFAKTSNAAMAKAEGYWEGKQGGANPHMTELVGEIKKSDIFVLDELPRELRT